MSILTLSALFKTNHSRQGREEVLCARTGSVADSDSPQLYEIWHGRISKLMYGCAGWICSMIDDVASMVGNLFSIAAEEPISFGKMKITSVTSSRISGLSVSTAYLIALGVGLDRAEHAKLVSGAKIIEAVIVKRDVCTLAISFELPALLGERWDIIVSSAIEEAVYPLELQVSSPRSGLKSESSLLCVPV